MKCAKCGRQQRTSRRHSNALLCNDCMKKNRGGNHRTLAKSCIEKTAQAAPSGNVKRKRGKSREKRQEFTWLADMPPTRETYGVVMRERSAR